MRDGITARQRHLLRTIVRGHPVHWPKDGIPTCRGRAIAPADIDHLEQRRLIKTIPSPPSIRNRLHRPTSTTRRYRATLKAIELLKRC